MARMTFENTGMVALAAAVPANVIDNLAYTEHFSPDVVKDVVEKTGIKERRFADRDVTSSDLCFAAAQQLFKDNDTDPAEIDALFFISQTPDYRMPATSVVLQDRLGLPKSTLAFDINLGCSGFIYALSIAYSFIQQKNFRKVLVLDGETRSKVYHPKDRGTAFIFGDGGVAALIGKDAGFGESFFTLYSDGSRESLIKMPAGGYRNPSSVETLKEKVVDEEGNIRSEEHGSVKGADVFSFTIREVPKNIKETLEFAGVDMDAIDYYLFHQANMLMNNYLGKKLGLNSDKVPMCLDRFGNTSSVSIPLTIVSELRDKLNGKKNARLLLSGFGGGLSWGTAIIHSNGIKISELVEI